MNSSRKNFYINMCLKFVGNLLFGVVAAIVITRAYYGYGDWLNAVFCVFWAISWLVYDCIDTYQDLKNFHDDDKFDE